MAVVAGWEWDDTLFSGTAPYYRRGRLPYAPGLADVLAEVLRLDGRGRLIDVGCGPGTLALSLAHLFAEIVGVDPDGGMLSEAGRGAAEAGVSGKSRWVRVRAEDLPAGLGTFSVATFAQSFHWMDRDLVAATIRDMLVPGGAFVHISDLKTERRSVDGLPYPAVPYAAMDELVRHYLGPVRRAGRGCCRRARPAARRRCSRARDSPVPGVMSFPAGRLLSARAMTSSRGCSRCRSRLRTCSARAAPPSSRTCVSCCGRCPRRADSPNASRAPRSSSGEGTPPSRESGSRRHEPTAPARAHGLGQFPRGLLREGHRCRTAPGR